MLNVLPLIPKTPSFSNLNTTYVIDGVGTWKDDFSFNASGNSSTDYVNSTAMDTFSVEINEANSYCEKNDNIISVSIGFKYKDGVKTDEISLVFGVKKKKKISELTYEEFLPSKIGMLQTDIKEEQIPTTYSIDQTNGVSISDGKSGSLTQAFYDLEDDTLVHMTNNHVIASNNLVYDENADTPSGGNTVASRIGLIWRNNPRNSSTGNRGTVKRVKPIKYLTNTTQRLLDFTNLIDAGLLNLTDKDIATPKCVGLTDGDSILVEGGPFPFALPSDLSLGMNVFRVSLTSGVVSTGQTISSINLNVTANFDGLSIFMVGQVGTTGIDNPSQAGDSGSPCFIKTSNGDIKFLGINWGGTSTSSVISPSWRLAKDLNIKAWDGKVVLNGLRPQGTLTIFGRNYTRNGYSRNTPTHTDAVIE